MKHLVILIASTLSFTAACESSQTAPPTARPSADESAATGTTTSTSKAASKTREEHRIPVLVTGAGYEPSSVEAPAGIPITLVFKRTTDESCGQELVFPDRNIRRDLPLNQEVEVELTPEKDETIAFTCGMGMYRGSIVASAL